MGPHALFNQLQEGNQSAVISLPSQRLILEVSDETTRLNGFLLPSENTVLRPTTPNQQMRATPRPQLQQQQRAQPSRCWSNCSSSSKHNYRISDHCLHNRQG
ncbi:hypothetical protein P3S67_030361 [Capsicum chacoense]